MNIVERHKNLSYVQLKDESFSLDIPEGHKFVGLFTRRTQVNCIIYLKDTTFSLNVPDRHLLTQKMSNYSQRTKYLVFNT